MKTLICLAPATTFWVALIAAVFGTNNSQAETRSVRAQVQAVSGFASYQVAGEPSTPIKPGTTIPAGATISTGAGASVDVFLGRNTGVIRLAENTSLNIVRLQVNDVGSEVVTDTALNLQQGEVFGNVNKLTPASSYQITMPDGVLDAQQSRFQVTSRALQNLTENPGAPNSEALTQSSVKVISGHAQFAHAGDVYQFNGPGEFDPSANTVTPLAPEAAQALAAVFRAMDTHSTQGETATAFVPPQNRALDVQLQDIPVSSTSGSSN